MSMAEGEGKPAAKKAARGTGAGAVEPGFEESLRRLEEIVQRLEAGEMPLEETLRLFEEGQGLVRTCGGLLERAEQRVKELVAGGELRDLKVPGLAGKEESDA